MTNFVREASRRISVCRDVDVIVAGGGPAGIAAAVSAAREGASTLLVEQHGCVGGVWTTGMLSLILDFENKNGLMAEIVSRLEARGAGYNNERGGQVYDVEAMKLLLEEMCVESGIEIRLHTRVCAALTDETGKLTHLVTESKSGREAWQAEIFVDATGDGDLAAQAGCGFDLGRPEDGLTQPMSLMVLLTGLDKQQIAPWVHSFKPNDGIEKRSLLQTMKNAGITPSYLSPILLQLHDNLYAMMANHECGVLGVSADDLTRATLRARGEVNRIVETLRASGGVWGNLKLVATGAQIGVREGRRVHGLYEITREDVISGKRHDDAVCRVTFPVDVHSQKEGKAFDHGGVKAQSYDIPLRALIARDVPNLLLAGRCISGDFWAHSSYRVTGNAVATGQAAGVLAARCAANGESPRELARQTVHQLQPCSTV
jgi:hypothetical protein